MQLIVIGQAASSPVLERLNALSAAGMDGIGEKTGRHVHVRGVFFGGTAAGLVHGEKDCSRGLW